MKRVHCVDVCLKPRFHKSNLQNSGSCVATKRGFRKARQKKNVRRSETKICCTPKKTIVKNVQSRFLMKLQQNHAYTCNNNHDVLKFYEKIFSGNQHSNLPSDTTVTILILSTKKAFVYLL